MTEKNKKFFTSFCIPTSHQHQTTTQTTPKTPKTETRKTMLTPDESVASLQRQVEIYENQRFWIGAGFSSKGLFPTERGAYSTYDGSLSWRTVEEAATSMLGKGWVYDTGDGFVVETSNTTTDDGWSYASDFSSRALRNCSKEKRFSDTVRRRKLVRMKRFIPKNFFVDDSYSKCRYCDSNAVDTLSFKILETLSIATLFEKNKDQDVTDAVAFRLKEQLMEFLSKKQLPIIDDESKEKDIVTTNPALKRLDIIHNELDQFAVKHQTVLSKASHVFDTNLQNEILKQLPARIMEVSFRYLSKEECYAIASLIVRYVDPEYNLHCNKENCNEECKYFIITCPNNGCDKKISKKYLNKHNDICGYKMIDCPLNCGDIYPRNKHEIHSTTVCGLRDVKCPFHKLGCTDIRKANEINQHVNDTSGAHLLLAMNRMMEYQSVMSKLHSRIDTLERENKEMKQQLDVQSNLLTKELANMNTRISTGSKKVTDLETKWIKDFRKLEDKVETKHTIH